LAGERVPSGPSWMEGMRVDAEHFDRMARTLGRSNSRRRVLGGLLGGALGGLLTRLDPEEAGATHTGCRHNGTRCSRPGQCCSGRCAGNNTCQPCTGARQCPAPPASVPCKKRVCTSTGKCVIKNKTDGVSCGDGSVCQGGACVAAGGGCYTDVSSVEGVLITSCACWTSGDPTHGGSSCGAPNTCATEGDGTCSAQGASCRCL